MVYGELGKHRLKILLQKRLINFWLHLKSDNRRQLSSILYSQMLKMNNIAIACDTKSWIADVKGTLDLAGLSNCWIAEEINLKWLTKSLARRLNDIDIQNWHSEVSSNSLCAFYRLIKNDNRLEPYLTNLKYKHRVSLTKFKCGNSNLPSSINRRNHTDQQPVCTLCDSGNQGDEYHYTMECTYFSNWREKFVPAHFSTHPNMYKMRELFHTTNKTVMRRLATFVELILEHFNAQ